MERRFKYQLILLFAVFYFGSLNAKEYKVASQQEFEAAAAKAKPGDVITIKNGEYHGWATKVNLNGSAKRPIVIRAERRGEVVFAGEFSAPIFHLRTKYTVIRDINFKNCTLFKSEGKNGLLIQLDDSENSRISSCIFENNRVMVQNMSLIIISGNGKNNEVDSCSFLNNKDAQDLKVQITRETCPQNTLIQNNLWRDKQKVSWKNLNGGECVQIGQEPVLLGTIKANATVRENTFIRCNGEAEVISNKSSNNKYIRNYLEDCDGEIVMRGGHNCLIDSNIIKGGNSGIRLSGTEHIVLNNQLSGVKIAIRLLYGAGKGKMETGFYVAPSNCVIKTNQIRDCETGILVGDSKNIDLTGRFDPARYPSPLQQNIAPFDNKIESNTFKNVKQEVIWN
ncbi:chondroitinase-B domain-containing protein [Desertivirga arenae]|uniref:chondroitinase-B domain-containing protein n=1 Tax=Desertivirga arenae TaxID=2810309 RepID=UPI001A96FA46|nr:chondroitinase-B domain-containing protein [Pedobacter sp. SYSU D00823]